MDYLLYRLLRIERKLNAIEATLDHMPSAIAAATK